MVSIVKIDGNIMDAADAAAEAVRSGGVIIYPTDTVYGIGGDGTDPRVIDRIHKIKKTRERKALSLMMADFTMIEEYCETGIWEDRILKRCLPGPFTFIVKARNPMPATEDGTIGIRIPDNEFCHLLCQKAGKPLISTSANITGKEAPERFQDIETEIVEAVDIAIDGGPTRYHQPSTVVDLIQKRVIRQGSIAIEPQDLED